MEFTSSQVRCWRWIRSDPGPGHATRQTHVWYCAGGEIAGSSASDRQAAEFDFVPGLTAFRFGAGIYKSTDNGDTWQLLPAASDPDQTTPGSGPFELVPRIVVSPVTGTVLVATNLNGLYRSQDQGASFQPVLGPFLLHGWSEEVAGPDGTFLGVLSSETIDDSPSPEPPAPGVFLSRDDGRSWTPITPFDFPSVHRRSVLAIAPSNPDTAYVLTYVSQDRGDGRDDIRFHKIDLSTGLSQDRTANLPDFPGQVLFGPSIITQGGYNMMLGIKPNDENTVIIGGITPYRSSNGFSSTSGTAVIGSYFQGGLYPNHHPDNHWVAFNPNNPDEMWSVHDGGISLTRDITRRGVVWEKKDTGYNTSQFYGVAIAAEAGDRRIIGGTQDQSTLFLRDLRGLEAGGPDFSDATRITHGDGTHGYIGRNFVYWGRENGLVRRLRYFDSDGNLIEVEGQAVEPAGLSTMFIQGFAIDPNDEQIMYYPARQFLWRNNNIEALNPASGWSRLDGLTVGQDYVITTMAASIQPAHRLYYGASHSSAPPKIYRLDQSNTAISGQLDISVPDSPPGTYVHDIAIHPGNADEILVVYSNYNVTGLFHSVDGGMSYTPVEGNLEGSNSGAGSLPGPSLRSASILPLANGDTVYFVGTSTGLFATSELLGAETVWAQRAFHEMGASVVEHLVSRPSDGRVVVGTHGRGLFVGDLVSKARDRTLYLPFYLGDRGRAGSSPG